MYVYIYIYPVRNWLLGLIPINQEATGDNSEVYSILERILSTATAVSEALKDDANAKDAKLISYIKELL